MQSSSDSVYGENFFAFTSSQAHKSANIIVPILRNLLPDVSSVADFGCAQGAWLRVWTENGIEDIQGVDGDYVNPNSLFIPKNCFHSQDLNEPINLGRRFDLVSSLEVAEHLLPENSERYIESLTRHADIIFFSAAPPGQGGETHINEQSFDSWRAIFRAQGYEAFDCIRDQISGMKDVSFWYRYNVMLYVNKNIEAHLPDAIRSTKIAADVPVPDISPFMFKIYKYIIRLLPYGLQNTMARAKAAVLASLQK